MFSISNDKLETADKIGDVIICPHCDKVHKIQYGDIVKDDGTLIPSKLLAFYKCGAKAYLAGIDGKKI